MEIITTECEFTLCTFPLLDIVGKLHGNVTASRTTVIIDVAETVLVGKLNGDTVTLTTYTFNFVCVFSSAAEAEREWTRMDEWMQASRMQIAMCDWISVDPSHPNNTKMLYNLKELCGISIQTGGEELRFTFRNSAYYNVRASRRDIAHLASMLCGWHSTI